MSTRTLRTWERERGKGCEQSGLPATGTCTHATNNLAQIFNTKGMPLNHGQQRRQRRDAFKTNKKKKVIYARVSSAKQKDDLQRQIQDLQREFPNHIVVKEIASGLNFKRKTFNSLLERGKNLWKSFFCFVLFCFLLFDLTLFQCFF